MVSAPFIHLLCISAAMIWLITFLSRIIAETNVAYVKRIHSMNKRQCCRSVKKHKILDRDPSGGIREIRPTDTLWYILHIESSPRSNRLRKIYRRRFRLPHYSFLELANEISHHELFARWSTRDCTGV